MNLHRGSVGDFLLSIVGMESATKVALVLYQIVTVLRYLSPVVVVMWWVKRGMLQFWQSIAILHRMRGIQQNCKLRSLAYKATDTMLDVIKEQPGGYSFWGLLPQKGRHNVSALRKKIADAMLSILFTDSFLTILLQAAITPDGRPRHKSQLYQWLLVYVYAGDVQRLYKDWLAVKDRECEV